MLLYIVLSIFLINTAVGYELSEATWRDMNDKIIQPSEYCENKHCIVKCCPQGQVQYGIERGGGCFTPKIEKEKLNYSNIDVYQWNDTLGKAVKTTNLAAHFVFIHNDLFSDPTKNLPFYMCNKFKILQNGSLKVEPDPVYPCYDTEGLKYCVEFFVESPTKILFLYTYLSEDDPEGVVKHAFGAIGRLISSFFMLLVMIVYSLISKLQNIVGKILMAYLLTFMIAYILQAAMSIALAYEKITASQCQIMSPANYFFIISTLFWLNVMSFDLWWTIRSMSKRCDTNCRSELVKFSLYCLYAWGTPLVLTLSIVAVDRMVLYTDENDEPPFGSCFGDVKPNQMYNNIPIGILTTINCIFYLLIAYNIWLVNRGVSKHKETRTTKSSENRFLIYVKLFVLTGVGWVFELVPEQTFVLYVIINFYNVFVGVTIFIIFVCKKSVITMLFERFNIESRFFNGMQSTISSRSDVTKNSVVNRIRRKSHRKEEIKEDIPINIIQTVETG